MQQFMPLQHAEYVLQSGQCYWLRHSNAATNKSVDSREILLHTVHPVCMNILLLPSGTSAASYTCKILKLETTHYKWQPSSSTPFNKNSDWPKPLTCDNTINPPSAILSLHSLWRWEGGSKGVVLHRQMLQANNKSVASGMT